MAEDKRTNIDSREIIHEQKMRRILGVAVITVGAIIVLLWSFAFKNRLTGFSWDQSDEKSLYESAQANWQIAKTLTRSENQTPDNNKQEDMDKIRETLTNIIINTSTTLPATNSYQDLNEELILTTEADTTSTMQ